MSRQSRARAITNYSFLVMFANDATIDADELRFIEKLALEDREIDPEERDVLRRIFARVDMQRLDAEVQEEIVRFRSVYGI